MADTAPTTSYVNFRDLGGHPSSGDQVVRTGLVRYRSDSLAHCNADDVGHLVGARGIRTVVDLRRDLEVERSPVDVLQAAGVRVEHRSLIDPSVPAIAGADVETTLTERYVSILESSGSQFVSVIRLIADDANHPLVFQCAAGKDRTGLVAAGSVLETLGVADSTIVADLREDRRRDGGHRGASRGPDARPAPLGPRISVAEASTMEATLAWLRSTHGGAEAYLTANGLTAAEVDALRTSLLDPA